MSIKATHVDELSKGKDFSKKVTIKVLITTDFPGNFIIKYVLYVSVLCGFLLELSFVKNDLRI